MVRRFVALQFLQRPTHTAFSQVCVYSLFCSLQVVLVVVVGGGGGGHLFAGGCQLNSLSVGHFMVCYFTGKPHKLALLAHTQPTFALIRARAGPKWQSNRKSLQTPSALHQSIFITSSTATDESWMCCSSRRNIVLDCGVANSAGAYKFD